MKRINEYFGEIKDVKGPSIVNAPVNCYKQGRDWTCSVACIRTAISAFKNISEEEIIKEEQLKMGGQSIENIKNWKCLDGLKIETKATREINDSQGLYDLLLDNYIVICASTYNLWHYIVCYGYLTTNERNNPENQYVLFYDPYLDEHKLINADIFDTMWYDIGTSKYRDYIAIKQD